jgi:dihydrodipicolinate reductase
MWLEVFCLHLFEKIKQVQTIVPVLICSNFSIGVVALKECINKILKFSVSDICIFEKHHKKKKDMPIAERVPSMALAICTKIKVEIC